MEGVQLPNKITRIIYTNDVLKKEASVLSHGVAKNQVSLAKLSPFSALVKYISPQIQHMRLRKFWASTVDNFKIRKLKKVEF